MARAIHRFSPTQTGRKSSRTTEAVPISPFNGAQALLHPISVGSSRRRARIGSIEGLLRSDSRAVDPVNEAPTHAPDALRQVRARSSNGGCLIEWAITSYRRAHHRVLGNGGSRREGAERRVDQRAQMRSMELRCDTPYLRIFGEDSHTLEDLADKTIRDLRYPFVAVPLLNNLQVAKRGFGAADVGNRHSFLDTTQVREACRQSLWLLFPAHQYSKPTCVSG